MEPEGESQDEEKHQRGGDDTCHLTENDQREWLHGKPVYLAFTLFSIGKVKVFCAGRGCISLGGYDRQGIYSGEHQQAVRRIDFVGGKPFHENAVQHGGMPGLLTA